MIYLNLGRREQGKTTLAAYLVRGVPRRVVFDPRGLFPAAARATSTNEIQQGMDALYAAPGELVITPDTDVQGCFNFSASEVKAWLTERADPIAFIVDELRMIDLRRKEAPQFDWILRCATRESVTVVCTAHRPADVETDIRAIADMWCLFHCTQEHDLKVIADRCSDDVAKAVTKLSSRQFIAWDDTRGTFRVFRDPAAWYVPLGPAARASSTPAPAKPLDALPGDHPRGSAVDKLPGLE